MKLSRSTLSVALLAALVAPAAHAEVALDVIGGSEVSFEGLVQADFYSFDADTIDYGADSATDVDGDEYLQDAHHWLILHGRYICKARKPDCPHCPIRDLCRFPEKTPGEPGSVDPDA